MRVATQLAQATGGDDEDDGADASASYSAVFCALGEDQVRVSESADVADLFSNFIHYSQPQTNPNSRRV
jgi:hypothetical protein